jgi:hypothetical protein
VAVPESLRMVLCALEPYLSPHTVLCKRQAAHLCAPVRLRFGGGAAHGPHQGLSLSGQEREQASTQTRGVRATGLCAHKRAVTHDVPHGRARCSGSTHGAPVRRQARLLSSLTPGERRRDRTRRSVSTYKHILERPRQLMGQDRQGLALPVCVLEARQLLLAPRIGAETQDCRFGKSP